MNPKSGYPSPGKQNITSNEVMKQMYFEEWKTIQDTEFDYVVIGSSYCALGFITRVAENNPKARILVLERGQYLHPCHVQNLPPVYSYKCRDASETFPWSISEKTHQGEYIKWLCGMCNFFGGRSLFWSGWCPEPTRDEMEHWPSEVIDVVHRYFGKVEELMNVTSVDQVFTKQHSVKPVYDMLQKDLQDALENVSENVKTITRMTPAPLSVKGKGNRYQEFKRHAVPEKLLELLLDKKEKDSIAPLKICIDCTVKKILHDGKKATALETSLGNLFLGDAKLILAMGTLPPTTLMLNSFPKTHFPQLANIGERYTAHFMTGIFARVPRTIFPSHNHFGDLEMAAFYIAGVSKKSNHQFHIQLVAIGDTNPDKNVKDAVQFYPALHTPQLEQLKSSKDHVIIACSALGQMDHCNKENWFHLNNDDDVTTNVTLQSVTNEVDDEIWNTMDDAIFKVIEQEIARGADTVEYWHPSTSENCSSGSWKNDKPTRDLIRKPATFHEASTMWIGGKQDQTAPVDLDYRPKGVDNVYITGASLYPTGASWNPTGVMVAMAMHLGDLLEPKKDQLQ